MEETFSGFHDADNTAWPRFFKLPFYTARDTKLQSCQFRLLHRIISCNKWLNIIKIKSLDQCSYCGSIDDIPPVYSYFGIIGLPDGKTSVD